jgi:ATP-dependent Clp protease ATP-binding subunit ClpB
VDFKNTIIIMTSNLGSAYLTENIHQDGTIDPAVEDQVRSELNRNFRPEFINRVDDIVVFSPLTENQVTGIVSIAMENIVERLRDRDITLDMTDAAKSFIAHASYDPAYGARPVKRYLQKHVETELATMLIRGSLSDSQHVTIDSNGETLIFNVSGALPAVIEG